MLISKNAKMFFRIAQLLFLILLAQSSLADTNVTGSVHGRWTAAGNRYNVIGDIYIPEDSTLIIEEGVDVYFVGTYSFTVYGLLQARGTEENMIIFGGGGGAGDWQDIYFTPTASSGCILDYCIIKDGGYEDNLEIYTNYNTTVYTNVFICNNDTSVTISSCE